MSDFQAAFNATFTLFDAKEKRNEKSPDKTGVLEIELEQAMRLAEYLTAHPGEKNYQGNDVIKIALSAWDSRSNSGLEYIRGTVWAKKPESTVNDEPLF